MRMKIFSFRSEQWLPRTIDEVFPDTWEPFTFNAQIGVESQADLTNPTVRRVGGTVHNLVSDIIHGAHDGVPSGYKAVVVVEQFIGHFFFLLRAGQLHWSRIHHDESVHIHRMFHSILSCLRAQRLRQLLTRMIDPIIIIGSPKRAPASPNMEKIDPIPNKM